MKGVGVLVLGVVCVLMLVDALSVDKAFTKNLEDAIANDELVVTLKHLKPRRRNRSSAETLFAVDFSNSDNKISILLDRTEKYVVIDTLEDGRRREQRFTVDTLEIDTVVRSLILGFDQKQPGATVSLYVDCVAYGKVAMPKTMRDMYTKMDTPILQASRERKYHIQVDRENLKRVLQYNNCTVDIPNVHSKRNLDEFTFDSSLTNLSLSNELADEPSRDYRSKFTESGRSDIPIQLFQEVDDCSVIIKAVNQLILAVNKLGEKIELQTGAISAMDQYLKSCDLCAQKQVSTCRTHPPHCFSGVDCVDTINGPRCGSCPQGYRGDGVNCEKLRITCEEKRCAQGVECHETHQGAVCGSCPQGYTGNGEYCERMRITCEQNPCFHGVHCYDYPDGPRCGSCPSGYTGDGQRCEREYSCETHPCFHGVECRDTASGPQCADCPRGYFGDGRNCQRGHKCRDRPCYPNVACRDTQGGAQCGECPPGLTGDGFRCDRIRESCRTHNPCYPGVTCQDTEEGPTCGNCPRGMTGNGHDCRHVTCQEQPCYQGSSCEDTPRGPKCGPCPAGYSGDGISCRKLCDYRPCGNGEYHCCTYTKKTS